MPSPLQSALPDFRASRARSCSRANARQPAGRPPASLSPSTSRPDGHIHNSTLLPPLARRTLSLALVHPQLPLHPNFGSLLPPTRLHGHVGPLLTLFSSFPQTQASAPSTTAPSTFDQKFKSVAQTVDPTDLWADTSATAGNIRNEPALTSDTTHERTPTNSRPSTAFSSLTSPPSISAKSTRARNAANRRHSKAKAARKDSHHGNEDATEAGSASPAAADSKTQRLREKNKLAAAKCRSRQRKHIQTIELKCDYLSAANSELKRQLRDLAGGLNGLRAFALQHQGCNCPVASYNLNQVRRVAVNLQAFRTIGVESPAAAATAEAAHA